MVKKYPQPKINFKKGVRVTATFCTFHLCGLFLLLQPLYSHITSLLLCPDPSSLWWWGKQRLGTFKLSCHTEVQKAEVHRGRNAEAAQRRSQTSPSFSSPLPLLPSSSEGWSGASIGVLYSTAVQTHTHECQPITPRLTWPCADFHYIHRQTNQADDDNEKN